MQMKPELRDSDVLQVRNDPLLLRINCEGSRGHPGLRTRLLAPALPRPVDEGVAR
jgi:hypothetical protein